MKKIIFLVLLVLSGSYVFGQVRITSDQVVTDSISFNKTTWINGFSTDATFATPSDKKVASQKATSTYIAAQIAAITAGVTDTAEVIRLISAYLDTVNISITANYDAVGDTIFTIFNGNYGYAISPKAALLDSLARHTDTLQVHNTRIKVIKDTATVHNTRLKAMELIDHTHSNSTILNATTSAFTTAQATRLADIKDTALVVIKVTDDTLTSSEVRTGWIFPIGSDLDGWNLVRVEALSPSNGNGVASIKVYRKTLAGATATVTTTGADIYGVAVISTTYDDVAWGGYYDFGFSEAGATVYTIGVDVYLKFVRP